MGAAALISQRSLVFTASGNTFSPVSTRLTKSREVKVNGGIASRSTVASLSRMSLTLTACGIVSFSLASSSARCVTLPLLTSSLRRMLVATRFALGEQLILPLIHPKLQIVSDDISQVCLVMAIDGGL